MKALIYPFGCSQCQHFTRSYVHSGFLVDPAKMDAVLAIILKVVQGSPMRGGVMSISFSESMIFEESHS